MKHLYTFLLPLLLFGFIAQAQSVTIAPQALVPTNTLYSPMYRFSASSTNDHSRSIVVYTAAELSAAGLAGGSQLTKLAWNMTNAVSTTAPSDFKIYLRNSTASALTGPMPWTTAVGGATLVYDAPTSINTTGGWVVFSITPFTYNGGSLEVITEFNSSAVGGNPATDAFKWQYSDLPTTVSLGNVGTSSAPTSMIVSSIYSGGKRANIRITFNSAGPNNAALLSIDSLYNYCGSGSYDVYARIQNFGDNQINLLTVGWELQQGAGVPIIQPDAFYNAVIDTFGGTGPNEINLLLGQAFLTAPGTYSIKAYIKNVNGLPDTQNANDTITHGNIGQALGGNFTIGGANPDYPTVLDAVNALDMFGVCAPVTFDIRPGTYTGKLILDGITGANSTNSITFRSSNSDSSSVIITSPSGTAVADNYTVRIAGMSGVRFENLTLARPGTTTHSRILVLENGASDIYVQNSALIGGSGTSLSNLRASIFADDGSDHSNIVITNNNFSENSTGIWLYGASSAAKSSGAIVSENYISTLWLGIFLTNQSAAVINGNEIFRSNPALTSEYFGISILDNDGALKIENNLIRAYGGNYGIRLRSTIGAGGAGADIINNLVQVGGTTQGGINIELGSQNINVYHNTVRATGNGNRGFFLSGAGTSAINIVNNNFVQENVGVAYYVDANATAGVSTSDFNNIWNMAGPVAFWGANSTTLADLQALSGKDANSVSTDPIFTTVAGFEPSNAALDGTATASVGVMTDYYGIMRTASPDMGAVEFSAPASDLGVIELLDLANGCGLGSTESFRAVIQNFGTQTQSGVAVNYTLNGGAQIFGVATPTIAAGGIDTVTITNVDLSIPQIHQISAFTSLSGDANLNNDTSQLEVENMAVQPAPTVNPVTVCAGSNALLMANATANVVWYDDPALTNAVAYGDTALVGPINSTTTYYAANDVGSTENVGIVNGGTGTFITPNAGWGLWFTANQPVRIEHVHVYPTGSGTITIQITDQSNNILYSGPTTTISGGTGAKTPIPVNISVPPGNYRMGMTYSGITTVVRELGSSTYPYVSPSGALAITGAGNGSATPTTGPYYWFYDWQISTASGCPGVTPVTVSVGNVFPTPNFTWSVSGTTVTFQNLTNSGVSYVWDFGDGSPTVTTMNPTHTFPSSSTYNVTLTATNACGSQPITYSINLVSSLGAVSELQQRLHLYPNPASSFITVQLSELKGRTVGVELTDINGKVLSSELIGSDELGAGKVIATEDMASGMYIIRLKTDVGILVKKFIVE